MNSTVKYPGAVKDRRCEWCGVKFTPSRRDQRFCRDSHRASMWSHKKAQVNKGSLERINASVDRPIDQRKIIGG